MFVKQICEFDINPGFNIIADVKVIDIVGLDNGKLYVEIAENGIPVDIILWGVPTGSKIPENWLYFGWDKGTHYYLDLGEEEEPLS